jgi:MSHA biogenesis protein MshP
MRPSAAQTQQGFAIFAAVFFLVVVGAMGGYMLQFSSAQQINAAQDLQGTRGEWAAQGALDWAIASVLSTGACASAPALLEGFSVAITCVPQAYDEAGVTTQIFHISVTAQNQLAPGTLGFVERSLTATVEK